jgi:hypothetical protein
VHRSLGWITSVTHQSHYNILLSPSSGLPPSLYYLHCLFDHLSIFRFLTRPGYTDILQTITVGLNDVFVFLAGIILHYLQCVLRRFYIGVLFPFRASDDEDEIVGEFRKLWYISSLSHEPCLDEVLVSSAALRMVLVTRICKDCIRSYVGGIDGTVHCRGVAVFKFPDPTTRGLSLLIRRSKHPQELSCVPQASADVRPV